MRRSLRVAVAGLATLSLTYVTPANADPQLCGQPGPPCTSLHHCHAGNMFTIVVTGPGYVQGTALCGQSRAFCDGFQQCTASNVAAADSQLGCDLSQGAQATCWTGVGVGVGIDPLLCALFVSLAPVVNSLTGQVYIDPTDGDLYVGLSQVWDCPPYGS